MSYSRKPKTINPNEVDPSVYYYDEVYDQLKEEEKDQREEAKEKKLRESSKYIKGLLETAELRKTEKELRRFKKYAEEGDQDEEVFITSTYKRKLEDMKRLEEDKRRRLEHEKDNSMNFVKKFESKLAESEPKLGQSSIELEKGVEKTEAAINPQPKPPRKELKTKEERRDYLRKLLAKRTVGKALDDAIARYKERKMNQKSSQ